MWRSRRIVPRAGLAALSVAAGCGGGDGPPPDTPPVLLAEGSSGGQAWRLGGRREGGRLCTSLALAGSEEPADSRCGLRRTPLRHLDAPVIFVEDRLLVFSALPQQARRVRLDGADGSLHVEEGRDAAGFPGRFFVAEIDGSAYPVTVRVFGDGGRAIVT